MAEYEVPGICVSTYSVDAQVESVWCNYFGALESMNMSQLLWEGLDHKFWVISANFLAQQPLPISQAQPMESSCACVPGGTYT